MAKGVSVQATARAGTPIHRIDGSSRARRSTFRTSLGSGSQIVSAGTTATHPNPPTTTRVPDDPDHRHHGQPNCREPRRRDGKVLNISSAKRRSRPIVLPPKAVPHRYLKEVVVRRKIHHDSPRADNRWRLWPQPDVISRVGPLHPHRIHRSESRHIHGVMKASYPRHRQVVVAMTPRYHPVAKHKPHAYVAIYARISRWPSRS
jgi:hypothetical protein